MDEPLDREAELPPRLVAWYKSEGVDVRTLGELWPESRYVRVPQRYAGEVGAIASSLSREVGAPAEAVEWLRPLHFLRLPSEHPFPRIRQCCCQKFFFADPHEQRRAGDVMMSSNPS